MDQVSKSNILFLFYFILDDKESSAHCAKYTGRNFGEVAKKTLSLAGLGGVYIYPGLPNGTEIGQECDQLFFLVKKVLYTNRGLVYDALCEIDGYEKATLTLDDFGCIFFGGEYTVPAREDREGRTVCLSSVFDDGLRPDIIEKARIKCGYCPANRNTLLSEKIRHEVIESQNGEINQAQDPLGMLLDEYERDNHEAAKWLIDNSYSTEPVNNLRRTVSRVTASQAKSRNASRTEPNTRERQDLLEQVKSAGQFFTVTVGGGAMNSSDMLYAFARKEMKKEAIELRAKKEQIISFQENKASYDGLLHEGRPQDSWRNNDYITYIR